jgi:hypothetical protein
MFAEGHQHGLSTHRGNKRVNHPQLKTLNKRILEAKKEIPNENMMVLNL